MLAGEALASNNQQSFTLKVIRDRVRVLHLAGRPSWDERFLRSMLRRDPNVDLVSFFILRTETDEQPWNRDELSLIPFPTYEIFEEQLHSFDLVIFQNFNYAPYGVEPFLPNVRDYVEEGGAHRHDRRRSVVRQRRLRPHRRCATCCPSSCRAAPPTLDGRQRRRASPPTSSSRG